LVFRLYILHILELAYLKLNKEYCSWFSDCFINII